MDLPPPHTAPDPQIREMQAAHLPQVAEIVNYYILNTAVNFRTVPQSSSDWQKDWERWRKRYPWLVATVAGETRGLAFASPHKQREAYDWSADVTVYVDVGLIGSGIGSALYGALIPLLDRQGFHSQVAMISLPNAGSVSLHEAFGFKPAGVLRNVGFKLDDWHDVGIWQRVAPRPKNRPLPTDPVSEKWMPSDE